MNGLLVIDVQRCFLRGGSLAVPNGEDVVKVINKVAKKFENVIITQDWHTKGHISFASSHKKPPFSSIHVSYGKQELWPDHCIQGTQSASVSPKLKIPHAQLILRKGYRRTVDSYSAFREADGTKTGLAGYLHERGITTLYLTGLATDFCVFFTAIDAKEAGFHVYVIDDATRGISDASIEEAWRKMSEKKIQRIHSSELDVHLLDISNRTVQELRNLAKRLGIPGYYNLKKEYLVKEIKKIA